MRYHEYNINNYVYVKLTEYGREIYRKHYWQLLLNAPELQEEDGWSKWQMWDLMHIFGPEMYMTTKLPFETSIRIVLTKCTKCERVVWHYW